MPHHKSAAKRVRTSEKARLRNVALRTRMRNAIKSVRQAKSTDEAQAAYLRAAAVLDRSWAKGLIPRATASRHKSRLARHTAKLSG